MPNTPNWIKNSGKPKKGRGISKGRLRARRQILQAVKAKCQFKKCHKGADKAPFSVVIIGV